MALAIDSLLDPRTADDRRALQRAFKIVDRLTNGPRTQLQVCRTSADHHALLSLIELGIVVEFERRNRLYVELTGGSR